MWTCSATVHVDILLILVERNPTHVGMVSLGLFWVHIQLATANGFQGLIV